MKKIAFSKKISAVLMSLTVFAIALFGMVGGAGWAGTALAQGTVPTQPPEALLAAAPSPTPTEVGTCGPGLLTDTASQPDVLRKLNLAPGYVQLGSAGNVASITGQVIAPQLLPGTPLLWDQLGCGIRTTGITTVGSPVVLFRRGTTVCFNVPGGFSRYRIAYFDPSPTINRWVFLQTTVDLTTNLACTRPSFRLPALFALFGRN